MNFKIIAALALLLAAGAARAGWLPDADGTVHSIYVFKGQPVVLFDLVTANTVWASCNQAYRRFAIRLDSEQGRAIYAQLVAAKLAGLTVRVAGRSDTNSCTVEPSSEDVGALVVW